MRYEILPRELSNENPGLTYQKDPQLPVYDGNPSYLYFGVPKVCSRGLLEFELSVVGVSEKTNVGVSEKTNIRIILSFERPMAAMLRLHDIGNH